MARLLLLAHAPLASALKAVAIHTFPELAARVDAIDVVADCPPDQLERCIREHLEASRACNEPEMLILTDVFGATPANVAQRLADGVLVRVLAGVNVPMLWRALNYAALPLDELVTRSMAGATQGVMPVASTRPQNQTFQPNVHDSDSHHHQQ
ncbi:PTS system ascorbate-specific IIA component [Sphaerotilus hippei]|uniref:PTS system ascorbate-specific IIA component n=1 Tax=Sphaerotilus hippei TaxID=744406 RepID=A0A318GYF7_9BURK|nr:PTS fructose transporter subunit IIA [Sphaerotilus hippei]PXW91948.1 PTS system ascorbate-specific IIA component [Sphaerotilus hippei]